MEFVGSGVASLSADFRIGIDVMTTETTCLSSIWKTDNEIKDFYDIHGRSRGLCRIKSREVAYYDGCIRVDLSKIKPMIAMPFHPSNTYTIEDLNANLMDILADCEKKALVSLDGAVDFTLKDKVHNGRFYVEQGIIAGCAGGGFENICAAADILENASIGSDAFTLSVYPASMPIYGACEKWLCRKADADRRCIENRFLRFPALARETRRQTMRFQSATRRGISRTARAQKLQSGQIASVALMDARSIAATAANKGYLTPATDFDGNFAKYKYFFDKKIYENRV